MEAFRFLQLVPQVFQPALISDPGLRIEPDLGVAWF